MTVSAETTSLAATKAFLADLGAHLARLIGRIDTARAALAARGLDVDTLTRIDRVRAQTDAMAAFAAAGVEHLTDYHGQMEQAVNNTPEAADTDFYQPGATAPGGSTVGTPIASTPGEEPDQPPAGDDAADEDEAYARTMAEAAAFIDATSCSYPRQAPPGKDLQHRPAEGYEDDDEQPWMSLPVRSPKECDHTFTVCSHCLESWSWGHDLQVADVPTSVDVDTHHATADEFYRFAGDPDRDLPPYWVARHDRAVTSQIADEPVRTVLLEDGDRASATFAAECCDTTPDGPGAPRPGDRIDVAGGPDTGAVVTVSSSIPQGNGYRITGTDQNGRPYEAVVDAWNYEIAHRPAQQPPPAAEPEPSRRQQPTATDDTGHGLTTQQLAALHGLYQDLVKYGNGGPTIYGINVRRELEALADQGVIGRTGGWAYMIPWGSPGEQIIAATPDFSVGAHLSASR
ncbi:hypothetical protein [Actinoplanes subglobosus]|uniref:Uncharacterized protein n=1 Tax=Actinoplanes subglobosus TaxID=1547892 RepID=A0ABV8IYF7_9ACTN